MSLSAFNTSALPDLTAAWGLPQAQPYLEVWPAVAFP